MSLSLKSLAGPAAILAALQVGANAIPQGPSLALRDTAGLSRRMEVNYIDCSDDAKTKLGIDFADATALAGIAFYLDDQSATAFTHYLRPEDAESAKSLWSMVAANNDPTNAPYTFSVRCAKPGDVDCEGEKKDGESLAVTDAQPQEGQTPREMKICPLYFTADVTKNALNSKTYEKDKRGSWCQDGMKFKDFETGGHTLLHEMTHLDALAAAAGLPARSGEDPSHATDDVDGYEGEDYTTAARHFKDDWVNHRDELSPEALAPFQNAENIAAAATEWWFHKSCGFDDISL